MNCKLNALTVLLFFLTTSLYGQPRTVSERQVSYAIEVRLDPETRTLQGHERVSWRNPDRVPVGELQFHLYLNGFRDMRSTFMRESGGRHRGFTGGGDDPWGGIVITRMRLADSDAATDLTDHIRFIQPDDGNPDDQTVISVELPQAVQPGETVTLDLDFEATLPRIFARTGWARKPDGSLFFMVGQWFPKFGVYEAPGRRYVPEDAPHGAWNTHQFHANSEFYADFGVYDVSITVPAGYTVGATGVRIAETRSDSTYTLTYRAEDVHDFAWTASNRFLEYTDRWQNVNLRLLLQPEHEGQAQRHFEAAKTALSYFDRWVGSYPYSTLTLVDGIGGSNGMEYPTLITLGTVYGLPERVRALELVTIHEFGHQYFYGLLASNEFEEAWLDEGINSYLEARIMQDAYGPGDLLDLAGLRVNTFSTHRLSYAKNYPSRGPIYRRSWDYASVSEYARASYSKPAIALKSLENYLGWETMQRILQTYYQRWRFRHPTTRDFRDVVQEAANQDMDWFFDPYIYGTAVVDYAIDGIRNTPVRRDETGTDSVRHETGRRGEVGVARKGDGVFPQTLRVRFEDGETQDIRWDGQEAWRTFAFDRPVAEAYLDPENAVLLDINRLNNRLLAEPDNILARKAQLRSTVWLQQLLYLISGLL